MVAGARLAGLSPEARADLRNRAVGFVFQSFNLLPGLSAVENVMLPGLLRRGDRAPLAATRAARPGGARRRGARRQGGRSRPRASPAASGSGSPSPARSSRAPKVLLADEPTGNLDAVTGEGIIRLFGELAARGLTVLVVTHEERVSRAASRVLHLEEGRLGA